MAIRGQAPGRPLSGTSLYTVLMRLLMLIAMLGAVQSARADWYYWRTDAVQTNTPPIGISVDAYCAREYATYESLYAHGVFQFHYLEPDPITRPARDGYYDGDIVLTAGNCRYEAWSPYSLPPQWVTGSFTAFYVAWAWCDGSAEWIPGRNTCEQPEERTCKVGNPVLPGSGREAYTETDYTGAGAHPIKVKRQYRSLWVEGILSGMADTGSRNGGWMLSMQTRLFELTGRTRPLRRVTRPDGQVVSFYGTPTGAGPKTWSSSDGTGDQLLEQRDTAGALTGWQYKVFADDSVESYDLGGILQSVRQRNGWTTTLTYSTASTPVASYLSGSAVPRAGLLVSVKNQFGREFRLAYDEQGRISQLLPPGAIKDSGAGSATSPIRYAYGEAASLGATPAQNQLTSVTWQDGSIKRYHYEDSRLPQALTGTTDEAGVRTSTRIYESSGRVTEEYGAGGADRILFAYTPPTRTTPAKTTITDYSGSNGSATTRTYTFQSTGGVLRPTAVSAPCPLCGSTQAGTDYDANGNVIKATAHDGNVTFYTYDAKGRETERAAFPSSYQSAVTRPALSAATSVTSTKWHATWNLPTQIAEPGKVTAYAYNTKGNLTGQSWAATTDATGAAKFAAGKTGSTYATGWGYNASSLNTSVVEKTDTTETGRWTMTYNAVGDVKSAVDVTHARTATMGSYDAHGRMLAGSTDMGVPIGFVYTPRGFVSSKTVNGQAVTFTQNAIGLTTQVNTPDGQTLTYVYDATYRLTDVKLNGAAITPQLLASSEYPDTRVKATWARVTRGLRDGFEGLIPSAWAQAAGRLLFPVIVVPGRSMPGQPEFDPRADMMTMAPMSDTDKAAVRIAETLARMCECKPNGGYSKPTFTSVTYAHVLFSGHLSERFSGKSYFVATEKVGQALVDEVMAKGVEDKSRSTVTRAVVTAILGRNVGYARTATGVFALTNRATIVYERTDCSTRFRAGKEVVTMYPESP